MASEQSLKMLAFGGEVLAFQTKKPQNQRRGSEVSFSQLTFNRESNSFSVQGSSIIHQESSAEINIVHCSSAFDAQIRQKVPCVLLRVSKKRTSAFKYILYSITTSSEAKCHVKFALPYAIIENTAILHGPTLLWSHAESVFYASAKTDGVKEIQIPFTLNFISELPLLERKIALQGTQNQPSKTKSMIYFLENGGMTDGAFLFPDAYSSVIKSMLVVSAEDVSGGFKSEAFAATTMNQLVHFENGFPRDVCALPFERPLNIQIAHTRKNEVVILVSFDQGNACAVRKDSFQVVSCWSEVRLLLVDDFLFSGTDQMLLLFQDQCSSQDVIGNFLLTDLCGVTFSSGLNLLEDLQRDMKLKDRHTVQSLKALNALLSGRTHTIVPPEQEGLVSLWDDDEDGDADETVEEPSELLGDLMETEGSEELLKVERVWQRVIDQSLVFGVVLKQTRDTSDLVLSASLVVACDKSSVPPVLSCRSVLLPFPSSEPSLTPSTPLESASDNLTLVSVVDVAPLLISGCTRFPIMLRCRDSECVSLYSGDVSINVKQIEEQQFGLTMMKSCTLDTVEAREDLLALLALLDANHLLLESSDHTLANVPVWFLESGGFQRLSFNPLFSFDPIRVRLIRWEQKSPFQAVLSTYCRDEVSLLHFLSALCDFLPPSHRVRLLKSSRVDSSFAPSLESEIHTILKDTSALIHHGKRAETVEEGVELMEGEADSQQLQSAEGGVAQREKAELCYGASETEVSVSDRDSSDSPGLHTRYTKKIVPTLAENKPFKSDAILSSLLNRFNVYQI
ncbi:hypothetical protein DNTS_004633 [Danionella cerebrum]|uniref:Uncharacterized protein n=1 Tax=Danionella cerebrum TaxID=2873325 RepID=A0A553RD05_9TELE|nr:hypothetical protein DNTS_004633 [Danionella translucida]